MKQKKWHHRMWFDNYSIGITCNMEEGGMKKIWNLHEEAYGWFLKEIMNKWHYHWWSSEVGLSDSSVEESDVRSDFPSSVFAFFTLPPNVSSMSGSVMRLSQSVMSKSFISPEYSTGRVAAGKKFNSVLVDVWKWN